MRSELSCTECEWEETREYLEGQEPPAVLNCPECGAEVNETTRDASKGPNNSVNWPGPTIGTWSTDGEGCRTYEEKEKSDWDRWGIVDVTGELRLLIIDHDLYDMTEEEKEEVTGAQYETRVHESQSGGIHVFFLVEEENLDDGKLPVALRDNVDDKLNGYVLSPDCEGYEVRNDCYPKVIDPSDLPEEWLRTERDVCETVGKELEVDEEDLRDRLEKAKEKDEKFRNLWEGKYGEVGYEDDRSKAEVALAKKIGFWFGRDRALISKLMDKGATKKWAKRTDDSYRQSVLREAMKSDKTYAPLGESGHVPIQVEAGDEGAAGDVGEFFKYEGDRSFEGRLQLSAEGKPKARATKLVFTCTRRFKKEDGDCAGCSLAQGAYIDFTDGDAFNASAFAKYFDTNSPSSALYHLRDKGFKPKCPAWKGNLHVEKERERSVTPAKVLDREAREGKAWFVHSENCDLSKSPAWIEADGHLCQGHNGRIGVLVQSFESEASVREPDENEVEEAFETLREAVDDEGRMCMEDSNLARLAAELRSDCNLKGNEPILKGFMGALLTLASPTWVKNPEGRRER